MHYFLKEDVLLRSADYPPTRLDRFSGQQRQWVPYVWSGAQILESLAGPLDLNEVTDHLRRYWGIRETRGLL